MTNWPDVVVCLVFGITLLGGICVAAWLVVEGHPWFALLILLIVGGIRLKTGENL